MNFTFNFYVGTVNCSSMFGRSEKEVKIAMEAAVSAVVAKTKT